MTYLIVPLTSVRTLPEDVKMVRAKGRPMHIPDGWEEQPGSVHMGDGEWLFVLKRKDVDETGPGG